MATLLEGVVQDGKVEYEVKQVYIHIPAEKSAAKFELKIAGIIRIITKSSDETVLCWDPEELTYQDVSSLYSNETDEWTIVNEEEADAHVIINEQPHTGRPNASYIGIPNVSYPTLPFDEVEPIVNTRSKKKKNKEKVSVDKKEAITDSSSPTHSPHPGPDSPVMFALPKLKCIKEGVAKRGGIQSLTFFLTDGKELPALHFYDGGSSSLIQSLKRYLYFVRDGKNDKYLRVEDSPFIVKPGHMTTSHETNKRGDQADVMKGVEGFLSSAVLEVSKRVRDSFRNNRDMLDERPRSSVLKEEEEEEIQTITCHDIKSRESGKGMTPDPEMSLITDFQVISDLSSQLPSRPFKLPRVPPLDREEWESYRQIDGRVTVEKEKQFRARVFAGGIEPGLRREVWKYLLGYFKFDATDIERMETQRVKGDQYEVMKKQWRSFLPEQEAHWHKWRDLKHLVDKDVIRTDRELDMFRSINSPRLVQLQDILNTYVIYNFDLGYVQGMSDLLAPILAVMDNECDAFWCFVGLMEMIGHYFEETQMEMRMRIKRLRALLNVLDTRFYQFLTLTAPRVHICTIKESFNNATGADPHFQLTLSCWNLLSSFFRLKFTDNNLQPFFFLLILLSKFCSTHKLRLNRIIKTCTAGIQITWTIFEKMNTSDVLRSLDESDSDFSDIFDESDEYSSEDDSDREMRGLEEGSYRDRGLEEELEDNDIYDDDTDEETGRSRSPIGSSLPYNAPTEGSHSTLRTSTQARTTQRTPNTTQPRGWRGRGTRRGRGQGTRRGRGGRCSINVDEEKWVNIDDLEADPSPVLEPFTQQPGPRITMDGDSEPHEFFRYFFDDTLLQMVIDGTNEYAERRIAEKERAGKLKEKSRWRKWKNVTMDEIKKVLAIVVNMGIIGCPDLEGYWRVSWESNIPFFGDVLPRNRFEEIFWMLHLPLPTNTTLTTRLDKVESLLKYLLVRFQSAFYPACELSVDETMIGFKGRVGFRQYCPLKPTKWGLKAFVLADSATGYVINILPYIGSETKAYFSNCRADLPMPAKVVMALCEDYLDKGHHIFADRFYSSVPLVHELESRKTGYTGTLVKNRLQLPRVVRSKKFRLQRGEQKAWRDDKKLVLAWRDKGKPTIMISTVCSAVSKTYDGRNHKQVTKPLVVYQYNQKMGGVDVADQLGVYYNFGRKCVKWWRKYFFWLLEVAMVNSYLLYRSSREKPLPHVDYRRNVLVNLCGGEPQRRVRHHQMRPAREGERFERRHYIERGQSRRQCIVCSHDGLKHQTVYFCKTCTHQPALHVDICFERYHELVNYKITN